MNTCRAGLLGILLAAAVMVGCSQDMSAPGSRDAEQQAKILELEEQVDSLGAQVKQLTIENAELKLTPSAMLAEIHAAVASDDEATSQAFLKRLVDRFPGSSEAATATELVEKLVKANEAAAAEAARLAALGFKALDVNPTFAGDDSTITLRSVRTSSRWEFDAYGNEWRYVESERGQTFVTARATVTSEEKNPKLVGLAVYKADGDTLTRIGVFGYNFSRWSSYASYLGNNADYRNDFAHSGSIPFSVGAPINLDQIERPLYIVATKEGCFTRREDRFGRPPVRYSSYSCSSLAPSLTLDDFSGDKLGVISTIK